VTAWHDLTVTKALTLILVLLLSSARPVQAQVWKDLQVRKTFNGGRDEQQPASFSYVFRHPDPDFALVDFGIKHKGYDWPVPPAGASNLRPEFLLYPSFEWHRGSAEPLRGVAADFNKVSTSLNAEMYFGDALGGGRSRPRLAPWMFVKADLSRNLLKSTTEGQISALASVYSLRNWWPGADTTLGGRRLLRYVPYVGFEHFDNLAIQANNQTIASSYTGWQLTTRLYLEVFPLMAAIPGENRLVVTSELDHRVPLSGIESAGTFDAVTISVDVYFDESQRFAVGVSHERGEFPKANFHSQRRTAASFRLKL
jgi:hypothetical protein